MSDFFNPSTLLLFAALIGVVAGNFYNGYQARHSTTIKDAQGTIDLINKNRDELERKIKDLSDELKVERENRIRAEEKSAQKDQTIAMQKDIIENRDPALKEFLTNNVEAMNRLTGSIQKSMEQTRDVLNKVLNTKVVVTHGGDQPPKP